MTFVGFFERRYLKILFLEGTLAVVSLALFFPFLISIVGAEVGENATVMSGFDVGTSSPNILSVNVEGSPIILIANSSRIVNCSAIIEDFDTEIDVKNVSAEFFHSIESFYGDTDDNNYHYTNSSCFIDTSYGDINQVIANCFFDVWYYANSGNWNCSVSVYDYSDYLSFESNVSVVETLLSFGVPESINYGEINATYVSEERVINVTNYGNVMVNLSLSGYAQSVGDGYAMNCSLGGIGYIGIDYEKFNLTSMTSGGLSLTEFEQHYENLTDSPVVKKFNLASRTDDLVDDVSNSTYWRIYVPQGVAGSCEGNVVFGATVGGEQ